MAAKADYYQVLGVPRDAPAADIKKAYREAARRWHPDRTQNDPESSDRFKEASEAYEVLSDAEKRAVYDRHGHAGLSGQHVGFNNMEDIFQHFGGGIFEEFFGGGRRRSGPPPGDSLETAVELTFEEVATGVKKTLEIQRDEPCDECSATGSAGGKPPVPCVACGGQGEVAARQGFFVVRQACPRCSGQGRRPEEPCARCSGRGVLRHRREIKVDIPAGVRSGERLRLSGYGDHGALGGPPGDLYCNLEVKRHAIFQRHEDHVVLDLPVSYAQMVLGTKEEVPTLEGKSLITIPRGSQHGDIVKVRGKGFPRLRGGGPGDQLVRLLIEVPGKVSKEEETLLRQLADLQARNVSTKRKSIFERIRDTLPHREGDE